jgi:TolA-binding protein
MHQIYRQIIILCLLLIPMPQEAMGAETVTLMQVTKNDSPTDSRIILHFSGLPVYRLDASGQRLKLIMRNVTFDQAFKILPEDQTVVKMEQQRDGDETTLSFLLRRPLLQVDSSFMLPGKDNSKDPAALSTPAQLTLTIHWQDKSARSSITILPKDRPAIMNKPVGELRVNPDRATASRVITSQYAGQWNRFLQEFENEITIPVPLRYSLPPFPVYALTRPAGMQVGGTLNYQEIIRQSEAEGWQQVAGKLEESVNQTTTGENREELLILYGEALVRAGFSDKARDILVKLHKGLPGSPVGIIAHYLAIYSIAAAGKPYDAAYELSFMQQEAGDSPLTPYLDLLQAEIALATGNIDKAEIILREKGGLYLGQVRRLFDLRRADMLFSAGRTDQAFTLYQALSAADKPYSAGRTVEAFAFDQALSAHDDILADHPSSLAMYAAILYRKGDYRSALRQYINLTAGLYDRPEQNLALCAVAMSQYHLGNTKEAGLIFEDVIKKFPASEGSFRARIKINDLFILNELENGKLLPSGQSAPGTGKSSSAPADSPAKIQQKNTATPLVPTKDIPNQDDFPGFDPALEYGDIAANAPLRALREEAAFKQALTYYFTAEYEKSAELLREFTRSNKSGQLTKEAEALLVELLPMVVEDKIDNKDYVDALVLAEQNRAILIGGKVKGDFLTELGLAFASLCFWNRAIRVYLYMMDIAKDKKEEEAVYLPLVQAYFEKNDLAQAEEYCQRYLAEFPDGQDRAAIVHLQISVLCKNNRRDEALRLLKQKNLPESHELHALAGRIFYEAGDYQMAEEHLAKLMTTGLNDVDPEAILMRAEALFRSGRGEAALPLYRHLEKIDVFADQAAYRMAQVHMAADDRSLGLKLLQALVEKTKSPLWRKMATESLAMEKI